MMRAQQLTYDTGQNFVVLTFDQQLYRVALEVVWVYPDRFRNMVLHLGGMLTLMSFVGSLGAESGLEDILSEVFGGVPKMLSGKKFPQNVRALIFLAEEVLRGVLEDHHFNTKDELIEFLEERANQSKTVKLWLDVLIKPVFIMMSFIRAEREGDWLLHLASVRQTMPYFFAAGHTSYARYGLYYRRSMENLPPHILNHFMKGEHVMHHLRGVWNGIWNDMYIKTTFMRYGHSKGGIIGMTLKPDALKIWALSRHLFNRLQTDLHDMEDDDGTCSKPWHKEEGTSRFEADTKDRDGLRKKLSLCIYPLCPADHPEQIVNIVSGRIGPPTVNVHLAIDTGEKLMDEYENKWPKGFYETIPRKVTGVSV
jgi:hypothetical protein